MPVPIPSTLQRIRRGLGFLAAFALVVVAGYKLLTGRPWLESVYWFVITVSSVGYGETSSASPEVQAFTIMVILVGMTAVAVTIGMLLQSLVQGEIRRAVGARRMTLEIKQLSDHVIICGYGRVGRILSEEFAAHGIPFVVIDLDAEAAAEAEDAGYLVVVGDATEEDELIKAGIERAKTLIVALHADAENVFLTLTARNLNRNLQLIARGEQPATEKKLHQAGADRVIMPAVIGARRISAIVTHPHTAEMIDLVTDRTRFDATMEEITVPTGSKLCGMSVRQARPRDQHGVLVVAIRTAEGEMHFNPNPDRVINAGDTVILMGKQDDIEGFRRTFVG